MSEQDGKPVDLESTNSLVLLLKEGDESARDRLIERCLPLLQSWSHGRLPDYMRDLSETGDLVQMTLLRALNNVHEFQPENEGAFLAYLRTILLNIIRDEARRHKRRPPHSAQEQELPSPSLTTSVAMEQMQVIEAYEDALGVLSEVARQAVVLRVEFGLTFQEVALELGLSSASAARMQVSRAMVKVADAMPPTYG